MKTDISAEGGTYFERGKSHENIRQVIVLIFQVEFVLKVTS